jgi:predicted N-acyltransferase
MTAFRLKWLPRMDAVDPAAWNALALPLATPFLEWEWLHLMEASGSAVPERGWVPCHLTVWSGSSLVAAAPLYIKTHSAGEFVFDHAWAEVARQLQVGYFPKLVGMSPFTPVAAYRFLVAPGEDEKALTAVMFQGIEELVARYGLSGCGFNYVDPQWRRLPEDHGYRAWTHQGFVWRNQGFHCFDDFLGIFKSNQRRNIRRERRALAPQGLSVVPVRGTEAPAAYFAAMHAFYTRTNDQFGPWAARFLTREFFLQLPESFRHRVLFMAAFNGRPRTAPVGMALLVTKGPHLYGRYWGAREPAHALHFNACYYQPIEWAIAHGLETFDPGIGGYHKVRRGFEAVPSFSLHRFRDPRMARVLQRTIGQINRQEEEQMEALNTGRPLAARP